MKRNAMLPSERMNTVHKQLLAILESMISQECKIPEVVATRIHVNSIQNINPLITLCGRYPFLIMMELGCCSYILLLFFLEARIIFEMNVALRLFW